MNFRAGTLFGVLLIFLPTVLLGGPLQDLLKTRGDELVRLASVEDGSSEAFKRFLALVISELDGTGSGGIADSLRPLLSNREGTEHVREELAWIIHTFARGYYREAIVRETGNLIRFKTFATDVPNRLNPEFIAQKEYLRGLAGRLGLQFNDVDGYVQEIWIGEGDRSFGIMSHSDVQPVEPNQWTHDPWSGAVIDGSLWGRGSVDDKGPVCAVIYGMRAMLDTGFPIRRKIVLLIGTDEESANEDVATYLTTHSPPDQTIVVDSNFPVVCAEKGWGGIWLTLPRFPSKETGGGIRIVDLQAGFSPSIVPEKGVARLLTKNEAGAARTHLELLAKGFMAARSGSSIIIGTSGDTLIVTATGKSVHSSVPATGHNALVDLLVFLDENVKPDRNAFSLMAKWATRYIRFELDGSSLGIAHHDDFMGDVTVAVNMFQTTDSSVTLMVNFRRPKGISREKTEGALQSCIDRFAAEENVTFSDSRYIGEPHYMDPSSPFVQDLLSIYNEVTGENRKAQSIGGGTYAHRIPNAVVFGPALPDEEYLGHQPNEKLSLKTLEKNIEILTHTIALYSLSDNERNR